MPKTATRPPSSGAAATTMPPISVPKTVLHPLPIAFDDLLEAALEGGRDEIRYLVKYYYLLQEGRMGANSQRLALDKEGKPHKLVTWVRDMDAAIEKAVLKVMDKWTAYEPSGMGAWAKSITGIGPVISAGLIAHIDIDRVQTVGQIWRLAGLDPTCQWLGQERARAVVAECVTSKIPTAEEVAALALKTNRHFDRLMAVMLDATRKGTPRERLIKFLSRRPWNSDLKVLLVYKAGESFVKVQNNPNDIYGKVFAQRKALEIQRNADGLFRDQAESVLARFNYGHDTEAYKWYSQGMLPPAHVHARARRYAAKLFVAHWFEEAYTRHNGRKPPLPYPIAFQGHAHYIERPNPTSPRSVPLVTSRKDDYDAHMDEDVVDGDETGL